MKKTKLDEMINKVLNEMVSEGGMNEVIQVEDIEVAFEDIEDTMMALEAYINEEFNWEELKDTLPREDMKKAAFAIRFFYETAKKVDALKADLQNVPKIYQILEKIKSKSDKGVEASPISGASTTNNL